jgi:hypothetical protein
LAKFLQQRDLGIVLDPKDTDTQRYIERAWKRLQEADWPPATPPGQCCVLNWQLIFAGKQPLDFSLIDPPGHDIRRLFSENGDLANLPPDLQPLAEQVATADFVILLANLVDFLGDPDDDRRLVSEMAIKFVLEHVAARQRYVDPPINVALVFTQADQFPDELMGASAPLSVVRKHLPLVFQSPAFQTLVATNVFAVAAVNKTRLIISPDDQARRVPEAGFASEGFELLMNWIHRKTDAIAEHYQGLSQQRRWGELLEGAGWTAVVLVLGYYALRALFG